MTEHEQQFEDARNRGVASFMVPCAVVDGELTVVEPDRLEEARAYEVWLKAQNAA